MKVSKKILAVVLSVMLLFSVMPFAAFAAEGTAVSEVGEPDSYGYIYCEKDAAYYLDKDISTTGSLYFSAYEGQSAITLDLNGHTFSTTSNYGVIVDNSSDPFTLTIKDSSMGTKKTTYTFSSDKVNNMPTGKIESTGAYAVFNMGNVVIDGGAIVGAKNAIINGSDAKDYNITVNNGYLEGGSYTISSTGTNCNITINGGVVYGKHMGIGLNGNKSGNTINVNGGYVIGKTDAAVAEGGAANAAIYFPGDDTLNINGGYIYGINSPAVVVRGGDVNITKGTITSTGDYNVTVASASTVVPTAAIVVDTQANYPGTANLDVDISAGTITSTNAADAVAVVKDSEDANAVAITGGTFKANGSGSDVSAYVDTAATGKVVDANGKIVDALFEVNGVKYAHVSEAVAAVPTNGTQTTVKLLKDVSDSGYGGAVVKEGQNVIFDLDGHTWTLRGTVGSTGTKTNGFQFLKGSTVKIENGTITAKLANIYHVIQNYADLTIENATVAYTGGGVNKIAVATSDGQTVIKNSTISVASDKEGCSAISVIPGWADSYKNASLVVEDSAITGKVVIDSQAADATASIELKGTTTLDGEISVPEEATGEFTVKNSGTGVEAPEGYKWDEGGVLTELQDTTVAVIGSTEYTTLEAAIAAVQDGETIKLASDVYVAATIVINDGKNFTIDTNGKTISSNVRVFEIRNGGVTLTGNGTLETTAISAVAVYGSADSSAADYATFTLGKDATISALSGYGAMIGANSKAAYGAKLTIDGTINSLYGVYTNGNIQEPADKTNAAQVTINGTVKAGDENAAVYAAGYAKWTVNEGATIEGGSGIYIKSGDLAVNGGTITAKGADTDYVFNTNGANGTGDAIIIDSCGYPGNVPTVAINGGSISSTNGDAVASYTKQDDPRYPDATFERVDQVIPSNSAAVFSSDVSALAEDGYKTVYDEDKGGYVVEEEAEDGYFLTIGNTIEVNYAINAKAYGAENGEIVVSGVDANKQSTQRVETRYNIASLPRVSGGAYDGNVIVTLEVAPAQIAEVFDIEIYDNDGLYKETLSASVVDYAVAMREDATYGELMNALINYGALAAEYFDYVGVNTIPASADYKDDLSAAEKDVLISRRAASLTTGNAGFDGMVYFAKVEPEFKFYFVNTNAVEAQLSDNDLSVVLTKTDDGVAAKVTGFKASDFGKTFSVTVDGTTLTVNGYAYIASALKSDSLNDLATGLFRYAQAAEAVA